MFNRQHKVLLLALMEKRASFLASENPPMAMREYLFSIPRIHQASAYFDKVKALDKQLVISRLYLGLLEKMSAAQATTQNTMTRQMLQLQIKLAGDPKNQTLIKQHRLMMQAFHQEKKIKEKLKDYGLHFDHDLENLLVEMHEHLEVKSEKKVDQMLKDWKILANAFLAGAPVADLIDQQIKKYKHSRIKKLKTGGSVYVRQLQSFQQIANQLSDMPKLSDGASRVSPVLVSANAVSKDTSPTQLQEVQQSVKQLDELNQEGINKLLLRINRVEDAVNDPLKLAQLKTIKSQVLEKGLSRLEHYVRYDILLSNQADILKHSSMATTMKAMMDRSTDTSKRLDTVLRLMSQIRREPQTFISEALPHLEKNQIQNLQAKLEEKSKSPGVTGRQFHIRLQAFQAYIAQSDHHLRGKH